MTRFNFSGLIIWYGLFLAQKINLTTADLGRHIKNGDMILMGKWDNLYTNFYSYTHPDYPVFNHHWGSGVIFFLLEKAVGFWGLSLFYILLSLTVFLIFFRLSWQMAGFQISAITSFFLIPLIAERVEVRPEIFTYLFSGLFFWLLWQYRNGKVTFARLLLLPALEIIWVNTHIYFIVGFLLIAAFFLEKLFHRQWQAAKELAFILGGAIAASLINPLGLRGTFLPFLIFSNYGYKIVENQSVWFLQRYGFPNPNLILFEIIFFFLIAFLMIVLIKNRSAFSWALAFIALLLSAMAWLMLRNFTLFGFFVLPILAYNAKNAVADSWMRQDKNQLLIWSSFLLGVILLVAVYFPHISLFSSKFGVGLMPGVNASAEFFKNQKLKGPILNNYDIGGYLIYQLFPDERVFVDNRPEAYPASFLKNDYIPLQENEEKFAEIDQKYNFNVIYFYRHDLTPWGQKFLIDRINDPNWAPVFVDDYAIISLKRNEQNKEIISRYEIPKELFKVIKTK